MLVYYALNLLLNVKRFSSEQNAVFLLYGGEIMNELVLKDLLDKVEEFNKEDLATIEKAYHYAEELHKGQLRQSGEPYISHPLNVAYILSEMHADTDTIMIL